MLLIDKYIIKVNLIWLLLFDPFIVIHEKVNNNFIHIDIDGVCLTSKCWPVVMRRINRWSCICSFLVLLMSCLLSNLATTFNYVLLRASYDTQLSILVSSVLKFSQWSALFLSVQMLCSVKPLWACHMSHC